MHGADAGHSAPVSTLIPLVLMMMLCRAFLECRSSRLQVGKLGLGQFADGERFLGNDDGAVVAAVQLDEIQPLFIEGFGYRIHAIAHLDRIRHGIP